MAEIYEKNVDYPSGIIPISRAVIPSANIIVIGGIKIGYVQDINETHDRPVTEQYEVGSVGPVELSPGQPKYSFTLNKVKIYGKKLLQIVLDAGYTDKYGGTNVKDAIKNQLTGDHKDVDVFTLITHNILPFDIQVWELQYSKDASGNPIDFNFDINSKSKVISTYVDCMISNYTKPVAVGNVNEIETMNMSCRRIDTSSL